MLTTAMRAHQKYFALNDGAGRDAAAGRHAALDRGCIAFRFEAANRDRALRDGINFVVRPQKGCRDQCAALQAFGVAQRTDTDVDARSLCGESGQTGGHHHGSDILGVQLCAARIDAETFQHRLHRLQREGRIA
jgi:hypothetical protein